MAHALVMRVSVCLSVCLSVYTCTMANVVRCLQEQSTLSPLPLVVQPSELQPPRPPVHMTRWNVATSSDMKQLHLFSSPTPACEVGQGDNNMNCTGLYYSLYKGHTEHDVTKLQQLGRDGPLCIKTTPHFAAAI